MADRFQHSDGLKAQDIELRGGKLQKARKGRMGHEAFRHATRGEEDRDKQGIIAKRTEKMEEQAEEKAAGKGTTGTSSYVSKKANKEYLKQLDEAGKY